MYLVTLDPCISVQVVLLLRTLGNCGAERDGGWKGVMQLWTLPAHSAPGGKRKTFMASTQGQPFEKKSWERAVGEAACLHAVSQQQ